MERTLYLSEKKGVEVRRDGPSLWIKEKGKAGWRIPARLVDMVVVIGNIRMDAGTVALFSECQVPVSFLNTRGETLAIAVPYKDPSPDHRGEQRRFFRIPGNMDRFTQWFEARERRVRLYVMSRLDGPASSLAATDGFRDFDYREFIDTKTRAQAGEAEALKEVFISLLRELIVERLVKAGLDPHYGILHPRCDFGFALDFCMILEAEADLQTLRFLHHPVSEGLFLKGRTRATMTKEGIREAVGRFEMRKKSVAHHLDSVIDSLFELFRDYGEMA